MRGDGLGKRRSRLLNRQAELLEHSSRRFRLSPTPDGRLRLAA
ncbi:hypothetical protein [Sphingomonas astaxanthinifaciens]|nr:hypothetical protein [Sphingomonas astaxanthinifaciens]